MTGRQVYREELTAEAAAHAQSVRASFKRAGLLVVLAVAFAGAAILLWLAPSPVIVALGSDQTGFLHDTSTYQEAAEKLFAGSPANRVKLTVNTSAISAKMKQEFPELATVTVRVPLIGMRPVVYIAPTQSRLLLDTLSGRTYVIDNSGRAVSLAHGMAAEAALIPVRDESGTAITVGQPVLAGDAVSFIEAVNYQLRQKNIRAVRYGLPAGTSELDLYPAGVQYFVKFNLADNSPLQQVGTFLAVRHALQEQGKVPAAYIDVRVDGRAYYK